MIIYKVYKPLKRFLVIMSFVNPRINPWATFFSSEYCILNTDYCSNSNYI
jgi:hypothetical protein